MVTFVHTGDIHLDTPFSANFNKQQMQIRRREIMRTFREIVLSAINKDFLFIAGDLFDGQYVSSETISFVKRCFNEIPDTKIFISAGNHDPLTSDSPYLSLMDLENVTVFSDKGEYVDFPEKQTRIHGRSFGTSHVEEPLLETLDIAPDWCNIAILHGEVVSSGGKCEYNPIEKKRISDSKADYIALGHIHQRSELCRENGVYYAYCGIPDGRGFDEEGEKGYYVGEASKGMVTLEWVPSSCRRFWHVSCDVTKAQERFDIQNIIMDAIHNTGRDTDCYKVILEGNVRRGMIDTAGLCSTLGEEVFYLDIIDNTKPDVLPEELLNESSLRGDFIAAMMDRIQSMLEHEKEIGYLALELGLSAMEGRQRS